MTSTRRMSTVSLTIGAGLLLAVAGCGDQTGNGQTPPPPPPPPPDHAQATQGWDSDQRLAWYQAGQGSRLMPWAWAKALEQKDSGEPFLADAHMAKFRFLALPQSQAVPKLPIGFAIDEQDDSQLSFTKLRWYSDQPANEQWLGLNCSACHTGQVNFQGRTLTVDGAPSLVDFQSFIEAADGALGATLGQGDKFDRFAAKVLAGRDTPANRDLLRKALTDLLKWETDNAKLNATPIRYGYGRLDAVGHIFNKVSQLAVYKADPPARATPNPADAPVSYPFLWDIYRQSQLQWNGIVKTQRLNLGAGDLDYGALGRNVGEVVGVFGDVVIDKAPSMSGYRSSIQAGNLDRLEAVLRKLQPPKWPAALDQAKVSQGATLYNTKGCKGCHTIEPEGTNIYPIHMVKLTRDSQGNPNRNNTDPWMACNAISYVSASGKMMTQPSSYFRGKPLPQTAPVATLLTNTVIGTLVNKWKQLVGTAVQIFFGVERLPKVAAAADVVSPEEKRAARLDSCYKAPPEFADLFAYKARPLDGIWATAPYLHNGSVPTLYDLLRDPKDRPASFSVGTRDFDPVKVGYMTSPTATGNEFTFTATGNGNSNEGHDYNVGKLTEPERLALLEYLKSL
jgi:hypothetical protein